MARLPDEKEVLTLTFKAQAAISGPGYAVKLHSDADYCALAGAGADVVGISAAAADADADTKIVVSGAFPGLLGATVADGAYVETDATYRFITATGLRPIAGRVLQGGAVGEQRTIILGARPPGSVINGAAVASAAAIVPTGNYFHVTGTTNITSITSTGISAGALMTIVFDGILTFTDGSNLVLAGNLVTTADDSITLRFDGTNWIEVARSVN